VRFEYGALVILSIVRLSGTPALRQGELKVVRRRGLRPTADTRIPWALSAFFDGRDSARACPDQRAAS
jgi:hypothetical protein